MHDEGQRGQEECRHPDQIMDAEEAVGAEGDEGAGQAGLAAHRRTAGDEKHDAAHQHHGPKRGDERIDVEERDHQAVCEPDRRAGGDPGHHAGRDPGLEHDHGRDAPRQRSGRTNREIEAAARR